MTVVGRLGALFVVLGGAALLLVDGLRSPPGLWYAAASIAAGTTMALYPVISSPSPRRPQPAPEPASPNTSEESTTGPPTRQTDSQSADTEQTAESTGSTEQEPEPTSDNDPYPPQPLTPEEPELPTSEQSELLATTVKKQQSHPADTGTAQRTTSNVEPVEQSEFGLGMSDLGPGVLIEEPVMDPEIGAEMLGLDGFAESPGGAVDLPAPNVENGSNPLFPEAESFFPEEDAEDDWLMF